MEELTYLSGSVSVFLFIENMVPDMNGCNKTPNQRTNSYG